MNLVELLLVKGARMDITNMGGDTPLHSAVSHGRKDIVAKVCCLCVTICNPKSCMHTITDAAGTPTHEFC